MSDLDRLEETLGLRFNDKSLLQRALTHRSYLNEHPSFLLEDNERLEFLGDAVLSFLTGAFLYHRFPELAEGPLTNLRAALVRRETLARLARQLDLGGFLLVGAGEAASGGRERPATLCGAFEALTGAIYLDQGLNAVQRFLDPILGPIATRIVSEQLEKDHKSRLQEFAQGQMHHTPRYVTVDEAGPDHAKRFTVEVTIGGERYGQGTGASKQEAAQMAALEALTQLEADVAPTEASQAPDETAL